MRTGIKNRRHLKSAVKVGLKARKLYKFGYGAAGQIVGVKKVPDMFDAAQWVYDGAKDPSRIPQRTDKLLRDTGKTAVNVARTVTNPKRMLKNTGNMVNSAGKTIGKLFK